MRVFTAKSEGRNRLGLREMLQRYADEQWVAVHMTNRQASESVIDCFKRVVSQELELLDLKCRSQFVKKPKPKARRPSRRARGEG
jgi:hypothetical protein